MRKGRWNSNLEWQQVSILLNWIFLCYCFKCTLKRTLIFVMFETVSPLCWVELSKVGISLCNPFFSHPSPVCFSSGGTYKWTYRYRPFTSGVFRVNYRKVGWSRLYLCSSHKGSMNTQRSQKGNDQHLISLCSNNIMLRLENSRATKCTETKCFKLLVLSGIKISFHQERCHTTFFLTWDCSRAAPRVVRGHAHEKANGARLFLPLI